ncbi:MAG TPA: hypothetical protein VGQ68_09865 [Gaiellaceae bacterium]|nr:hypothetical protein [Gaiellaceae bacterium]
MPPEPPDERPAPPPLAFPDLEGGECPRCGTPYEPLQEYCLECGLRLPVERGVIAVLSTAWRRRIPWYPGDWVWIVLLLLVVAALAATVAVLATRENEKSATPTKVATTESVPVTSGSGTVPTESTPTGTESTPTGTEPPPTESGTVPTTEPPPPPPPPASGGLTPWPSGQNGWTVVLASIPQSSGRRAATSEARKALSAGLTDVGVLDSSEFSSLHSGYYVVFSGVYSSLSEAKSGLSSAESAYPKAYTRQITQ